VLAASLIAWDRFAATRAQDAPGLRRDGNVFSRAARDLGSTLHDLPPPRTPRVAIFGSSQIAVVKDNDGQRGVSFPFRLASTLSDLGVANEVVDFSDGGQQLIESAVILLSAGGAARPSVVVVGVSLFSMMRVEVRPTLLEQVDVRSLRAELLAKLPPGLTEGQANEILAVTEGASQRIVSRGKTIQQRLDRRISEWLDARVDAIRFRQVLFDELIDTPLRRDLVALVTRRLDSARTARTYRIGAAYESSLAGVEVIARWCSEHRIPLVVVLLPYDDRRAPVPFESDTQRQLSSDLEERAARAGFQVIDFSPLLGSEHFRSFVDGSPDNLHFDAAGHDRLARALGPSLAAILTQDPSGPGQHPF